MEKRKIYFDKAEVMLLIPDKDVNFNLLSNDINRIQFEKCKEYKLGFIPIDSEQITISSSKLPYTISYTKGNNKKYFEDYKKEFEEYAKTYNVTFGDTTKA